VAESDTASTAPAARPAQIGPEAIRQCGDGEGSVDVDGDGLSDATENCLGTSPYEADTDHDGLSDKAEITPLNFGGQNWYSDPLSADTNHDGLPDGTEWPTSAGGTAASWDPDGDGVPNPWDADNDGDGVADRDDLSPFSAMTPQASLNLRLWSQPSSGEYVYLTFQVRPANPDHLRYGAVRLDWPHDEDGTIRDLEDAGPNDDVVIYPLLEVLANTLPTETETAYYQITHLPNTDPRDQISISLYLVPAALAGG